MTRRRYLSTWLQRRVAGEGPLKTPKRRRGRPMGGKEVMTTHSAFMSFASCLLTLLCVERGRAPRSDRGRRASTFDFLEIEYRPHSAHSRHRVPADLLYIQDILYNTYVQSEAPESSHTSATHVSYFESQSHVSAQYRYPVEGWGEAHISYL